MVPSRPRITVLTSLYRCERYLNGYFEHLSRICNLEDVEILLLHNEPSEKELGLVREHSEKFGENLRHIIIERRESLYRTWNRGISLAKSKYIAIWNVDDIRLPDSLEWQARTLDENPEVGLTYGDMIVIYEYGETEGRDYYQPEYEENPQEFIRGYFGGCFPMWRKSVHEKVGYYDEQMLCAGDYDFWIRVVRSYPVKKTKGLMGYFLSEGRGLSTSGQSCTVEKIVIALRYCLLDKIGFYHLSRAIKNYDPSRMHVNGKASPIHQFFPGYCRFVIARLISPSTGVVRFFLGLAMYLYKAISQILALSPS